MGPYKRNAWNIVNKSSTVGKQNNAFIQAVKDIFNAETANARRKAYRRHILKLHPNKSNRPNKAAAGGNYAVFKSAFEHLQKLPNLQVPNLTA